MKTIVLFLLLLTGVVHAKAQLVDVIFDSVGEGPLDDPFFGNPLPAGYTAYRIYARLQDPTDRISAVFGSESPGPTHTLKLGSSLVPNSIYNNSGGGFAGETPNCALFSLAPALEFDSYITIGQASNCTDCVGLESGIFQITNPPNQINASFAGGGLGQDLTIINGSWFLPNDGSCNGFGQGPDNRVLIAQVTIPTGTLEYWLNIAIFDEAVGANQLIYVHTMEDTPGMVGQIPEIDGTCQGLVYPMAIFCDPVPGCLDPIACNYNPYAYYDDGASCTYNQCGCTDPLACNFDVEAINSNGSCIYPGCTDPGFCNYNPMAGCDDGSCAGISGCSISNACNYNPNADCFGPCILSGCTNPLACNFNSTAGCDNGTCYIPSASGYIFHDANGDQYFDEFGLGEPTLFNWAVTIPELGITVYSDENGFYNFPEIPDGTYIIQLIDESDLWQPSTLTEYIAILPSCFPINFGLVPTDETLLLAGAPCCIWAMNIHCTNGFNPGLWIENEGSTELHGTFTITCSDILTAVPLWNATNPDLIEPGLITWNIDQGIGQNELYQCHINGPGAEYIGQAFPFELHLVLYDDDNNIVYDNSWTLTPIVVCAYDPNDKYAEPEGYSEEHFVLPDGTIEYRIRFQNTGNFPAEDIVVVDQLDTEVLDITTFNPLFASANFYSCIHDDGLVEFIFNDINLPDSTSDEPGSQGFVVFNIRPIETLPPGTEINNTASIYFDGNPPIVTNTTWHTIFDCSSFSGISGDEEQCLGEVAVFDGTQNYVDNYYWISEGETISTESNLELSAETLGIHSIELIVSNPLCDESNSFDYEVFPLPIVLASEDQDVCEGDAVTVEASGASEFSWDNGLGDGASQTFTANETTTYTVTGTDLNDCSSTDQVTITVHDLPSADVSEDGATLTAPEGTNWQWYYNNELIEGATNQEFVATNEGSYYVITTNEFGCSSTSEIINIVGIENHDQFVVLFYPNPVKDISTLQLPEINCTVNITNSEGKSVYHLENLQSKLLQVDCREFAKGVYTIHIQNLSGKSESIQVMVE